MKDIENAVTQHYGNKELLTRILAALESTGVDPQHPQPEDLAAVDEFHIGGRKATAHAVKKMSLEAGQHVLDVGCGIGGTARYIAIQTDCRVSGIDLTAEYISTAKKLTELTCLSNKVYFEQASALDMPFDNEHFDAAITIHVAMNIPERAALYNEIARVLKPGAIFCLYDVMKKNDNSLNFPVPWAESAGTSHLVTVEEMHTLLHDAGFDLLDSEDRTDFAIDFFKQNLAAATKGPAALGIHLVMGANAKEKMKNILGNIENGSIAPVQMMARLRG